MARRVPPLNHQELKNTKATTEPVELIDGAVPGLRVRIMPSGSRFWSLSILDATGKRRRFAVGENLGLADARDKAAELRLKIRDGEDPQRLKQEARQRGKDARDGIGTLEAVLDAYFGEEGAGAGLRTKNEQVRRIKHVLAKKLSMPARDISDADLQLVIDAHPSKSSAAAAVRYLSPVLQWAAKRALMPKGVELEAPVDLAPAKRRVLSADELCRLLPYLTGPYGKACRIMLLTGVRLRELTGAVWSEIDFDAGLWIIPGERRKDTRGAGRRRTAPAQDHAIPLSAPALVILRELRADREARQDALGKTLPSSPVFIGPRGGGLDNWSRELAPVIEVSGVGDWSAHAMRRTCSTLAGNLGVPPHVVSVILGHKSLQNEQAVGIVTNSDLQSRYNQSRYLNEHKEALAKVAKALDQFEYGKRIV